MQKNNPGLNNNRNYRDYLAKLQNERYKFGNRMLYGVHDMIFVIFFFDCTKVTLIEIKFDFKFCTFASLKLKQ